MVGATTTSRLVAAWVRFPQCFRSARTDFHPRPRTAPAPGCSPCCLWGAATVKSRRPRCRSTAAGSKKRGKANVQLACYVHELTVYMTIYSPGHN